MERKTEHWKTFVKGGMMALALVTPGQAFAQEADHTPSFEEQLSIIMEASETGEVNSINNVLVQAVARLDTDHGLAMSAAELGDVDFNVGINNGLELYADYELEDHNLELNAGLLNSYNFGGVQSSGLGDMFNPFGLDGPDNDITFKGARLTQTAETESGLERQAQLLGGVDQDGGAFIGAQLQETSDTTQRGVALGLVDGELNAAAYYRQAQDMFDGTLYSDARLDLSEHYQTAQIGAEFERNIAEEHGLSGVFGAYMEMDLKAGELDANARLGIAKRVNIPMMGEQSVEVSYNTNNQVRIGFRAPLG